VLLELPAFRLWHTSTRSVEGVQRGDVISTGCDQSIVHFPVRGLSDRIARPGAPPQAGAIQPVASPARV